ncbi:MAG: basic amino acid/polyamine antiporter, family [Candidatus Woesearchaeota archaeon]|nr:basic amino acid/polyamine antiporter, family [Candidatus Woesearchaeota archaeon]
MDNNNSELKKSLNLPILIILAITSVMGSGIFFVPAISVQMSGGSAVISWILVGLLSMVIVLYFAELASMFPSIGGVYEFAKQAYNQFTGFLIGWIEWIIGNLTTAMLVVSALQYFFQQEVIVLFNIPINASLFKIVLGILILILFNYVAFRGIEFSSMFVMFFGLLQLILIIAVIIVIFFSGNFSLSNFNPFFLSNNFKANFTNLFITFIFIADIFLGMESVFSLSEETKNPSKVVPKAVIWAQIILSIVSILSLVVIIGYFGVANLSNSALQEENPGWVYQKLGFDFLGEKGSQLLSILIFLSILGSAADWIVSAPRLLMAMARDKVFIPQLNKVHPVYKTPYRAIIFQSIIMILFTFIGLTKSGYATLVQILMPLSFAMISAMLIAVTYLRIKKPNLERPFKAPAGKIGPLITTIILILIIAVWIKYQANATILFSVALSFILIGFPFYLLMQLYNNPKLKSFFNEHLTKTYILLESVNLPRKIRKEIITLIGDFKDKTIVEYGCGVGTLTQELIKHADATSRIIAADQTERNLEIVEDRISKIQLNKEILVYDFYTIHDPNLELKFEEKADVLIFNGILDSVNDLDEFLKRVKMKLKDFGQIYFIEFCDLFGFLPNPPYLSNELELEQKFKNNDFVVRLVKRPGFLWNYLIIYGFKVRPDYKNKREEINII